LSIACYVARWVLPMDAPFIENGEIIVEDGIIQEVRPRHLPASECRDFGDAVILPGLIDAHTHLEYTALRGFLEDIPFFPWIRALTAAKAQFSREDWLASARLGALEAVAAGITTIGDNTDAGVTMQAAAETGLRGIIYQEFFGIDHRQPIAPIMQALHAKVQSLRRQETERVQVGISPHALYTVRPALFEAVSRFVTEERLPTSIHVAESPEESALVERGNGPFAEMFQKRGIVWETPAQTPTRYLWEQSALTPATLAVHCVHQTPEDIDLLARSGAAIVHCPKSNAKLGAGIAPLTRWQTTPGLRVALGTDSAVSNNTLDLWEEMRFALLLQRARQEEVEAVTAQQVLRMATLGGAEALGLAAKTGSLTPGKRADLVAVNLSAPHVSPSTDPYAALVYSARADDVVLTICDGFTLYDSHAWPTLDAALVMEQAGIARRKAGEN
jgi:5-methylthioadenosine/S-adenosylhomocysteine deaminase